MPSQNMPLWHEDYFELKAIKKQQTQEGLSVLHLSAEKWGHTFHFISEKFPFVKVSNHQKQFTVMSLQKQTVLK